MFSMNEDILNIIEENKKIIIIVTVIFLLLGILGGFLLINSSEKNTDPKDTNETDEPNNDFQQQSFPGVNIEDKTINTNKYINEHQSQLQSINSYDMIVNPGYNRSFRGSIIVKKRGDNVSYKQRKIHKTKTSDYKNNIYLSKFYDGEKQYIKRNTESDYTDAVEYNSINKKLVPSDSYPTDRLSKLLENVEVVSMDVNDNSVSMLLRPKDNNNLAQIHGYDLVSYYTIELESDKNGLINKMKLSYTGFNENNDSTDHFKEYNIEQDNLDNLTAPDWVKNIN